MSSKYFILSYQKNRYNTVKGTFKSKLEKLWFIGDVKNQKYRQLAIAMGDGVRAAMEITAMLHK